MRPRRPCEEMASEKTELARPARPPRVATRVIGPDGAPATAVGGAAGAIGHGRAGRPKPDPRQRAPAGTGVGYLAGPAGPTRSAVGPACCRRRCRRWWRAGAVPDCRPPACVRAASLAAKRVAHGAVGGDVGEAVGVEVGGTTLWPYARTSRRPVSRAAAEVPGGRQRQRLAGPRWRCPGSQCTSGRCHQPGDAPGGDRPLGDAPAGDGSVAGIAGGCLPWSRWRSDRTHRPPGGRQARRRAWWRPPAASVHRRRLPPRPRPHWAADGRVATVTSGRSAPSGGRRHGPADTPRAGRHVEHDASEPGMIAHPHRSRSARRHRPRGRRTRATARAPPNSEAAERRVGDTP